MFYAKITVYNCVKKNFFLILITNFILSIFKIKKILEITYSKKNKKSNCNPVISECKKNLSTEKEKSKSKKSLVMSDNYNSLIQSKNPKRKVKEHKRPATTTPPAIKRKKMEQSFVANSISAMKKSKNFSSIIKEPRISSFLVCKFNYF